MVLINEDSKGVFDIFYIYKSWT